MPTQYTEMFMATKLLAIPKLDTLANKPGSKSSRND